MQGKRELQVEQDAKVNSFASSKTKYLLILFTLVLAFRLSLYIKTFDPPNTDFWLHLKVGQVIFEDRTVWQKDIFSYGETKRWVNQEWLFQILLYTVYHRLGWDSLILLKAILGVITCIFLLKIIIEETKKFLLASLLTILAASVVMYWMQLRPQLITYLFLPILYWLLYQYEYKNKNYLYAIPILLILWANFHAGVLAGFLLLAIYIVSALIKNFFPRLPGQLSKKRLGLKKTYYLLIVTIISLLGATLINPNTYHIYPYFYNALTNKYFLSHLTEWRPPDLLASSCYTYDFMLLLGTLAIALSIKRINLTDSAIFFTFALISLLSRRNIPLFAIIAAPLTAKYLHKSFLLNKFFNFKIVNTGLQRIISIATWTLLVGGTCYMLALLPREAKFDWKTVRKTVFVYDGVEFIKLNNLSGRMFNDIDWGGYFLWKLYPWQRVAIDTRYDTVYSPEYIKRYSQTMSGRKTWEKFMEKYKINCVLILRGRPLSRRLFRDKNWIPVYPFLKGVVFIKDIPANKGIIQKYEKGKLKFPQTASHYFYQGLSFLKKDQPDKAIGYFKKALKIDPQNGEAYNTIGIIYAEKGKTEEAIGKFKKAIEIDPRNMGTHLNLGRIYVKQERYKEARLELKKVLKIDPRNMAAKRMLERLRK